MYALTWLRPQTIDEERKRADELRKTLDSPEGRQLSERYDTIKKEVSICATPRDPPRSLLARPHSSTPSKPNSKSQPAHARSSSTNAQSSLLSSTTSTGSVGSVMLRTVRRRMIGTPSLRLRGRGGLRRRGRRRRCVRERDSASELRSRSTESVD